jgi:hypothetical protein
LTESIGKVSWSYENSEFVLYYFLFGLAVVFRPGSVLQGLRPKARMGETSTSDTNGFCADGGKRHDQTVEARRKLQ